MDERQINEATVEALLQAVKDLKADEASRTQSLDARGSALAGLVGLTVSLLALVGRGGSAGLSRCVELSLTVSFIAALVLLFAAVLVAVLFVLIPKTYKFISLEEIERYPSWAYITEERVMAQGRLMKGFIESLGIERERNKQKATALRVSYSLLALGIACIAIGGAILGITSL